MPVMEHEVPVNPNCFFRLKSIGTMTPITDRKVQRENFACASAETCFQPPQIMADDEFLGMEINMSVVNETQFLNIIKICL